MKLTETDDKDLNEHDRKLKAYLIRGKVEINLLEELQRQFEIAYYSGNATTEQCEIVLKIMKNGANEGLEAMKKQIDYLKLKEIGLRND